MNSKSTTSKPLTVTPSVAAHGSKSKNQFQALWDEAQRVKLENQKLEETLDSLVERIRSEVGHAEKELGVAMRAQIDKLIVFAGRKSLSQWQLHVLNEWIFSTLDVLEPLGLFDDALRNSMAQLQASAYGINIDSESELSAVEQLTAGIDEQLGEFDMLIDDEDYTDEEDDAEDFMQWFKEKLEQLDLEGEFEPDARQYGQESGVAQSNSKEVKQPQTVFKKLFHRVARALHPDKETDPEKIKSKQALMSELLDARRQHDLMRVVELYQEHVDEAIDFGDQELEELENVLLDFIEHESQRLEDIATKTYLHEIAFNDFYNRDPKKMNRTIARKIKQIETHKKEVEAFSKDVTSLIKLRPYLENRYDQMHRYF